MANGESFGSLLGLTSPPADDGAHPGLRQIAFTIGVIALGAKMARADGEVSEIEAAAFRDFFQVPPGEERNVERFFNLAKRDVAGFETYARQLAALFPDAPEILENVLEGLFSIAKADGPIDVAEAAYLAEVSRIFGLSSARFERAKAAALGVVECEPCTILGIDPLATDEQIREAWLRQVKANHPDRLMAQGLPEEAIAMANRKLALINDAYDRLRRERGLVACVIELPSPNHAARQSAVDVLVLHYTELPLDESLKVLRDDKRANRVSAHYVLAEDGTVYRLVSEDRVAWHAGRSHWRGRDALNGTSIGIEIVNLHGDRHDYPDVQIDALIELCRDIVGRHPAIVPRNVVGHSDIAPKRKVDPGLRFPWAKLAASGIGLWPRAGAKADRRRHPGGPAALRLSAGRRRDDGRHCRLFPAPLPACQGRRNGRCRDPRPAGRPA